MTTVSCPCQTFADAGRAQVRAEGVLAVHQRCLASITVPLVLQ